jgi:hypothetical protein
VKSALPIANYFADRRPLRIAHFQLPIVSPGKFLTLVVALNSRPMIALYLRDNWQLEMGNAQVFLIMDFDPLFW